jgi:hypothetical protein
VSPAVVYPEDFGGSVDPSAVVVVGLILIGLMVFAIGSRHGA